MSKYRIDSAVIASLDRINFSEPEQIHDPPNWIFFTYYLNFVACWTFQFLAVSFTISLLTLLGLFHVN